MNPINKIYYSDKCTICDTNYKKNQINECQLLKCGHIFHEKCISTWVNQEQNCPTCKRTLFVPISLKDVMSEGIEGAKKSVKYIAIVVSITAAYAVFTGIANHLFPGRWPTTEEEIDAHIKEHGVIFDLRKPEGFFKLGISTAAAISFGSTFYMIKSFIQQRNQLADASKKINFVISDQQ
jgi:hypothetical protein